MINTPIHHGISLLHTEPTNTENMYMFFQIHESNKARAGIWDLALLSEWLYH